MKLRVPLAMLSAAMLASGVQAADTEPCAKDMVCASAPETVVKALQDAGYKALLSKSETTGNPMIESSANGYNYNIFFYECEERKSCASLLFGISFTAEDSNTPQLANEWNKKMRFMQMAVDDDKVLHVNYDITTKGGLNQKNFADVVDWWSSMLAELRKFFDAHPSKK